MSEVIIEYIQDNIAYWRRMYSERGVSVTFKCALVGRKTSSSMSSITMVNGVPIEHHELSDLDYLITRDGFYLMMLDRANQSPADGDGKGGSDGN